MARYIDADFLIEQLQPAKNAEWNKRDYSKSKSEMIEDFCTELRNTRIADVVEVVSCSECKFMKFNSSSETCHCKRRGCFSEEVKADDYCSYGIRKEDRQ
jgi:hypothetical protein